MPFPLILLALGGLGLYALSAGPKAPAGGGETGPNPSPDTPSDPGTPGDSGPARSGRYKSFLAAYASTDYGPEIRAAESANGLPANLLARMIFQESGFNNDRVGSSGELGMCQFLPTTAADPGYGIAPFDPTDPEQAIPAMGTYVAALINQTGSTEQGVAAYNFGIGNITEGKPLPTSTANYVKNVMADIA